MTAMSPWAGLIIAGFEGKSANDASVQSLIDRGVGGYIVFGRNVDSPHQVHALLSGIRNAIGSRPAIFAVDQEGGRVARLRAPLTVWPPMASLGATGSPELARNVGQAIGDELAAIGFTMDFAPVLDVRRPETTDAIGDRALSSDPQRVGALGSALIDGLHEAGLAACAKHFPGHGMVEVDSHVDLPSCSLSRDEIFKNDLLPFDAALNQGVDAIMTAHVLYPAVDSERPATLSPTWIEGILRHELGFDGVVLSDDLEMGAILKHGGIGAACVSALKAGVDGLLICRHLKAIDEAITAISDEAERNEAFRRRCDESLGRLEGLARTYPPHPMPLEQLNEHLNPPTHQALAKQFSGPDNGNRPDPTQDGSHHA